MEDNICKSCHKNPINTSRSTCKCTDCLDKAKKFATSYYHSNKDKILVSQKEYYEKNKEHIIQRTRIWELERIKNLTALGICVSCGKNKIAKTSTKLCEHCLSKRRVSANAYRSENVRKVSASKKISTSKNPDKYRKIKRNYYYRHLDENRHSRKLEQDKRRDAVGSHTLQEWKSMLRKFGNKCLWCESTEHIERDHVVPLSQGGTNFIENIQPLCKTCNRKKWKKIIDFRPFGNFILDWT